MYKVLLVDDEPLDLIGLTQLVPWEQFDMEVAAAVHSGFAALDFLKNEPVDVLITDIKMPIMSGIELAAKAKAQLPALNVIFVSGYEDFQYAKQAIQMNVHSYILKPIKDAELFETLRQVKEQQEESRMREQLEKEYKMAVPLVKNEILLKWLQTGEHEAAYSLFDKEDRMKPGHVACITVIELDDVAWKLKKYEEKKQREIIKSVWDCITDYIELHQLGKFAVIDPRRMMLFINHVNDVPYEKLEKLIHHVRDHSPLTVTIGAGHAVNKLQDLPLSYQQAMRALSAKMFVGKDRLIQPNDTEREVSQNTSDLEEKFAELFTATTHYDLVKVHDVLEDFFHYAKKLDRKVSVHNFSLHVISKMETYLHALNLDLYEILGIEFRHLEEMTELETINDIKSWLRRALYEISEYIYWQEKKPQPKLIQEIEQYVEERLADNVTLRNVAEHFAFSPNYLGYLFKEAKKENFSDYLIRQRMNKAKSLLQDTRLKIYEVSEQVGYKNLAYFSRHFKAFFGMTPSKFRKQGIG